MLGKIPGWSSRWETPYTFSPKAMVAYATSFASIHQLFEEKFGNQGITAVHVDLTKKRMDDDFEKISNLVEWFKTIQLMETDAPNLVSYSTGEVCLDETVNTEQSTAMGMSMLSSLDGGNFTSKVHVKDKCANFNALRKKVKVKKKDVCIGAVYSVPKVVSSIRTQSYTICQSSL